MRASTFRAFFVAVFLLSGSALAQQGQQFTFDNSKAWRWPVLVSGSAKAQIQGSTLRVDLSSLKVRVPENYSGKEVFISSYTVAIVGGTTAQNTLDILGKSKRVIVGENLARGAVKFLPAQQLEIPLPADGRKRIFGKQLLVDFVIREAAKSSFSYARSNEFIHEFLTRETTVVASTAPVSGELDQRKAGQIFTLDNNSQKWAVNTLGTLSVRLRGDKLIAASDKLVLSVRSDYILPAQIVETVSVEVVTRNAENGGWNTISKTRDIPVGKRIPRGESITISLPDEPIPFTSDPDFPFSQHWIVLTATVKNDDGRSGTVHAHSDERLIPMVLRSTASAVASQKSTATTAPSQPQEVVFAPVWPSLVAQTGSAKVSSSGPFLVLTFTDYLIRTDDRNQGRTIRLDDLRFRLVSKEPQQDGTRLIRESEPVPLNHSLTNRISKSFKLPTVKIPIDGIPVDKLGEFRLVADLRVDNGRAGVPAEAHPRIDPSLLP